MKNNIKLMSFGFKYGQPNANFYFDVGFIKNPAREKKWGFFSKLNKEMREFVLAQPFSKKFIDNIVPLIELLNVVDQNQIFAFGCSAGRHRSTIIVETIADILRKKGVNVDVEHRDMG